MAHKFFDDKRRAPLPLHSLISTLQTKPIKNEIMHRNYLSVFDKNLKVHDLLTKLGLCDLYPQKLQLKDVLKIKEKTLKLSANGVLVADSKLLPGLTLQKIMSYDYNCRSDLMANESDESISDAFGSFSDNEISPLDCILAVLICSDDFLRQDLLSRLATCQLSIPLILPDPFTEQLHIPLWGMRSIIKEWKCIDDSGRVVQQTHPIVSYKMPIISFMRFGDHCTKYSKSVILNEIISKSEHKHFFHQDCSGGEHESLLKDGLVDMCWYLPGGKPSDRLKDAATFLNLHGDAGQQLHHKQVRFLSQKSSVCFILLTNPKFKEDNVVKILRLFSSSCMVTLLIEDKNPKTLKSRFDSLQKKMDNMNLHVINCRLNLPKISEEILKQIKMCHEKKSVESVLLEDQDSGLLIDENHGLCKKGLEFAQKVVLASQSTSDITTMLPLQGKGMWKDWAVKDKEANRQKKIGATQGSHDYGEGIKAEKLEKRREQLKHIEPLTKLMKSFLVSLLELGGDSNRSLRNLFIQSLKLELNQISRNSESKLVQKHEFLMHSQDEAQKKRLQKDILESSIGLEHLLREVGQMYEAVVTVEPRHSKELSCLPKAAAELLIDGWPLEIMDGDAAHVPLKWVSALLQEAAEILKKHRVFILSVVGLQSSGKSTMLNTVFGLQFNVSAGRCTRGAFMQLLPLDEELRRETNCSYVLVVDTEGLRAPSSNFSDAQQHDNELATFVIGLANMTLVNIMGEVYGDIDDILQTSVHAFLRMKKVNLSLSCKFVHQSAGTTNEKAKIGTLQFTEKLNKCTRLAAEQEHCEGEYDCFSDVIKFDSHTDVHPFPVLWKGDQPMSPVNPGYSCAAQMIKYKFVEMLKEKHLGLELSRLPHKINDLWTSLLREDFVFSFKNTLEIIAYKELETKWSREWRWPFNEEMLKWEQQVENEFDKTKDPQSIQRLYDKKCKELPGYVSKIETEIGEKMENFFEDRQYIQWKEKFQINLRHLSTDLRNHADSCCSQLKKSREGIIKYDAEQDAATKMVRKGVQERIAKLRKSRINKLQLSEQELETEFELLWLEMVPECEASSINVEVEVEKKLISFNAAYSTRLVEKIQVQTLREWGKQLYKLNIQEKLHYTTTIYKRFKSMVRSSDLQQKAQKATDEIFDQAVKHLQNKKGQDFKPAFTLDLLQTVDNAIGTYEITFTEEYRLEIYVIVCGYAVQKFEDMAETFKQKTDPRLYLERNVKHVLFEKYRNQCHQVANEQAIAYTLCASLERPIIVQLRRRLGVAMVHQMKQSDRQQHFSSKMALKAKILTDLREEDNFEAYMAYVKNVKRCLKERIKNYTIKFCDTVMPGGRTKLQMQTQRHLDDLVKVIEDTASEIHSTNVWNWLSAFCTAISEVLVLNLSIKDLLDGYDSNEFNLENFQESIKTGLKKLKDKLHAKFATVRCEKEMVKWSQKPFDILKPEAVGCTAQCPFCGEQCDYQDSHAGLHRTAIHRPTCVNGWRKKDTQILVVDLCPAKIASSTTFENKDTNYNDHPFRKYKEIYPDWHIIPDPNAQDCLYWKWFVAKYKENLSDMYSAKIPDVPMKWLEVSKDELIEYVQHAYYVDQTN